ncbi:RHS repeat-associated core domain-containing protein [Actinokineospora diospyrosa]|uniref:RHS repeat-associated core domain-containing protein n=1 Tax=Actinokineospora diospyrosa TaxID=103728 RepID=UPI0020A37595
MWSCWCLRTSPIRGRIRLADRIHGELTGTRFYPLTAGGQAVRTGSGTNYHFEITDPHNTGSLVLNNTAQTPIWRQSTPYGEARGPQPAWSTQHGFLNKPVNTATGLTDVGARKYDPTLGRFISVDPILDLASPQSWTGYAYANNNPTTYSDPTGLIADYDNIGLEHSQYNLQGDGGVPRAAVKGKGRNCDSCATVARAGPPPTAVFPPMSAPTAAPSSTSAAPTTAPPSTTATSPTPTASTKRSPASSTCSNPSPATSPGLPLVGTGPRPGSRRGRLGSRLRLRRIRRSLRRHRCRSSRINRPTDDRRTRSRSRRRRRSQGRQRHR